MGAARWLALIALVPCIVLTPSGIVPIDVEIGGAALLALSR
jgi:hypothetical protein